MPASLSRVAVKSNVGNGTRLAYARAARTHDGGGYK